MFSTLKPEVAISVEGATFTALVASSLFKYLWMCHARAMRDQLFTLVGHVTQMTVYPVKSCGGVDLKSAMATELGLSHNGFLDRRWMVQSLTSGVKVNMKDAPRLTLVTCAVDGDWMIVSAPDMTPLRLHRHPDPSNFPHVIADVNGSKIETLDLGKEASEWMTRFLCQPVRLLQSGPGIGSRDAHDCPVPWDNLSRRGDKTVFAHLTSYLLTTTASLSDLNSRLSTPVTSRNFRPNIVVDNKVPFDEDEWEEIRIGTHARFHYVQPCRRCPITTIDPITAERSADSQPLASLRKYRQRKPYGHSPLFGAYVALDCSGPIKVGDPVYAIRRQKKA